MLYPKMTQTRMLFELDGVWDFKLLKGDFQYEGVLTDTIPMPVPSSYNDIYVGKEFKNHVGNMVYQRKICVTKEMKENRIFLRFCSVTHKAQVYVNDKMVGSHKGGFLPFEFEVGEYVTVGENLITVIVDNIIDYTTLPTGRVVVKEFPNIEPQIQNLPSCDFFNYSGIMRPVYLYTTNREYIKDITIWGNSKGEFEWDIELEKEDTTKLEVQILDKTGNVVFTGEQAVYSGKLEYCNLWGLEDPYLYQIKVQLKREDKVLDEYIENFGFRDITIKDCRLHLNGKKVYLKGFGKHEDSPVLGRGFSRAYNVKDISLLKWIGANSFRTSHYPYSEEMLELCDREGILVIAETPAVGLHTGFTETGMLGGDPSDTWKKIQTGEHHEQVIRDMIKRDKNHPCIIMWSVANEPASEIEGAKEYFEPLTNLARELDPQHRPVTIVTYDGSTPDTCKVAELCDVIVMNRYRGWYDNEGNLKGAAAILKDEFERMHKRCPDKPIMLGEYGVDTIAGMHDINEGLFSEEYQVEFLKAYGEVFDSLSYITGEHIWNFADFATAENIKRVQGNKKGIFTRTRAPKMAAYFMRERWTKM